MEENRTKLKNKHQNKIFWQLYAGFFPLEFAQEE